MTEEELAKIIAENGGSIVDQSNNMLPKAQATNTIDEVQKAINEAGGSVVGSSQSQYDLGKDVAGYAGATTRGVAGGVTSPVSMVFDPLTNLLNLVLPPEYKQLPPSQGIQKILTMLGVPQAETEAQKILQASTEGATSALTMAGGARTIAKAVPKGAAKVLEAFAAQPKTQAMASAVGAGAAETAKQLDASPEVQLGAGLVGATLGVGPKIFETLGKKLLSPEEQKELGALVKKASGSGIGATSAQIDLARIAKINPQAREAADRLGIELPADVFSDNPQIASLAGLTRSVAGSESQATWKPIVDAAVEKADNVLRELGAVFSEGRPSTATVSQMARDKLLETRKALNDQATELYGNIEKAVPKEAAVKLSALKSELDAIAKEVGESGLSPVEKELMGLAAEKNVTYGRLIREKNRIGKAIGRYDSTFGNIDSATLKRLYAALAQDQLSSVERLGGAGIAGNLAQANRLYSKERDLGKMIVSAFGKDLDGSVGRKLQTALISASKDDATQLEKILKLVPDDLKRETVATALASVVQSPRGGFSPSEFATIYPKLLSNAGAYKQIVENLGDGSHQVLQDLYQVSKRISDAKNQVLTTGKANQALVDEIRAEGVISKILAGTVGRVVQASAALTGGAGPVVANALANGRRDGLVAAGKLFASPKFQQVLLQGPLNKATLESLAASTEFANYAKAIGLPAKLEDKISWLTGALASTTLANNEGQK